MKFELKFGALAPRLHQQLPIAKRRLRYLQDCADGIVALSVGRLLTEAETHRARVRLGKRVLHTFGKELVGKE